MKKLFILVLVISLLTGCSNQNNHPTATISESHNYIIANGGLEISYYPKDNSIVPTEIQLDQIKVTMEKRLNNLVILRKEVEIDKENKFVIVRIPYKRPLNDESTPIVIEELREKALLTLKDPEGKIIVESKDIVTARAEKNKQDKTPFIVLSFNDEGKQKIFEATSKLIGKNISINIDSFQLTNPSVEEPIAGGEIVITGMDSIEMAQQLAYKINAGPLPYDLAYDWKYIDKAK